MHNFTIFNPTTVHFGKNVCENLGKTVGQYGKKALIIYGKGSIKNNGIYDMAVAQLKQNNISYVEFQGIKPNPLASDVDRAAQLIRAEEVDVILAVGGGSVIDSAKVLSVVAPNQTTAWPVMTGEYRPEKSIPLIAVLTLAATGTEMNPFAVLQNPEVGKKIGYGNPMIYPKHSFLDPTYTFSVNRDYTAYGIVDLMAHAMENYFGKGEATLSDRFVFSILKEAIEYGPQLLNDMSNYDLRSQIMYAATMALNGLTAYGRVSGDWGVHDLGHTLSLLYDTPHGASLSIGYPAWLKLIKEKDPDRIAHLGKEVFNATNADSTILALEEFFKSVKSPIRLSEAGISSDKKNEILQTMVANKVGGANFNLSEKELEQIVDYMDAD